MKKLLFLLFITFCTMSLYAQYRDVKLPEKPRLPEYKDYYSVQSGFWFSIEAEGGSSIMAECTNMQFAAVTATGGYRINEFLRVGAGLGAKYYFNKGWVRGTDNKFGVPIFANLRGNFISAYDCDGVPFWSLNIGGITKEGIFASPTIGYSFGGLRNNFLIGISYTISSFTDYRDKKVAYSYFGLKLGYEF